MVKDYSSHEVDSMLIRSTGSESKWNKGEFNDIFDQPKLKLQQLFCNPAESEQVLANYDQNTGISIAPQSKLSKIPFKMEGTVMHDDLFLESFGTLTKNRLSNIMDTIPDTYSKDCLGFTWQTTKSSSGPALSQGVQHKYPDDIDFIEGSASDSNGENNSGELFESNIEDTVSISNLSLNICPESATENSNIVEGQNKPIGRGSESYFLNLSNQNIESLSKIEMTKDQYGLKM